MTVHAIVGGIAFVYRYVHVCSGGSRGVSIVSMEPPPPFWLAITTCSYIVPSYGSRQVLDFMAAF